LSPIIRIKYSAKSKLQPALLQQKLVLVLKKLSLVFCDSIKIEYDIALQPSRCQRRQQGVPDIIVQLTIKEETNEVVQLKSNTEGFVQQLFFPEC